MIDKSIALNLSIQLKDSNKSLEDLNKLLVKSKEHLKNVGKNSKEFKKLDASVKKVEKSMSKSSKTITKMGGSTKKLNTNIAATGKAAAATASGTGALGGSMVLADRATGGLASKMLFLKTAAGKVVQSLKSVKVAMMATGIGLLLVAVLALKAAFTSSEGGQNKFAKIMGVIGAITGNLVDLLADLGEKIIGVLKLIY